MKTKFVIQPISNMEALRSVRKKMPPVGTSFAVEKGKGSFNRKKLKQQLRKEIV